jgi:hypothetical protein
LLERFSITMLAVSGRLRCANRPYSKALIACSDHFPPSTLRTVNRHLCRGSLPIPPDFF